MKYGRSKNYKIGQIRFNFRHKHYGILQKVEATKNGLYLTAVFITSKPYDGQSKNVPMIKPFVIDYPGRGSSMKSIPRASYFAKRVRRYPAETFSDKYAEGGICLIDRIKSRKIYRKHEKAIKKGEYRR